MRFVLFIIFIASVELFASRWIAEGVRVQVGHLQGINILKTFSIGEKVYTIFESPEFQSQSYAYKSLLNLTQANYLVEDIPIYQETPVDENTERGAPGWHIKRMRYDALNPESEGQGIVVAVMDTGVDIHHKNLAQQIWTNPGEIPNNNIDDDANGYIDDIHGWDFTENQNVTVDEHSHGTHCAGIIAASPNTENTGRGVAPRSKIMPLKIIGGSNKTFLSDAAEAVVYGANNGAKILSNSWGLYASWNGYNINPTSLQIFVDAMNHAYYMGTVYIASAGNNGINLDQTNATDLRIPLGISGIQNMIGIASADFDGTKDLKSSFSNYGVQFIEFAAPGSNIVSTIPNNKWESMSGTSMATPLFAGVMARMLSRGYTWWEAVEVLGQTADPAARAVWQNKIRYGLIQPEPALK